MPTPAGDARLASRPRCQRQPDSPPLRVLPADRLSLAGALRALAPARASRIAARRRVADDGRPGRSSSCARSGRSARSIRAGARTSWSCCCAARALRPVGLDGRPDPGPPAPHGRAARAAAATDERPTSAAGDGRMRSAGPADWTVERPGDLVETRHPRYPAAARPGPGSSSPRVTWSAAGTPSSSVAGPPRGGRRRARSPGRADALRGPGHQHRQRLRVHGRVRDRLPRRGIRLFVLPPRSPKLHGAVERANRTHTEEFYEVTDAEPELEAFQVGLRAWETVYNTIRPHQSLGYLTPAEFLASVGVDV